MMRRETATIGHKRISYLVSEPAAPATRQQPLRTVVFLHAFPLHAAMWEANAGAVPAGWRAVAPDFRGCGESPLPESGGHRISDLAGDVIDLLDHLEVTQAVVIGCSMGGYVLFEMLRSAPRYVAAVGLVSTRPGADTEDGKKNREKMIEQLEREGVDAIATQMAAKLFGPTTQRNRPDLVKHACTLIGQNTAPGIRAAISAMRDRLDSTQLLAAVTVPALVVAGVEDTLIPPAEAEAMHRALPASRCELMPFAGHLPNLEQPAPFDALLGDFLLRL